MHRDTFLHGFLGSANKSAQSPNSPARITVLAEDGTQKFRAGFLEKKVLQYLPADSSNLFQSFGTRQASFTTAGGSTSKPHLAGASAATTGQIR